MPGRFTYLHIVKLRLNTLPLAAECLIGRNFFIPAGNEPSAVLARAFGECREGQIPRQLAAGYLIEGCTPPEVITIKMMSIRGRALIIVTAPCYLLFSDIFNIYNDARVGSMKCEEIRASLGTKYPLTTTSFIINRM